MTRASAGAITSWARQMPQQPDVSDEPPDEVWLHVSMPFVGGVCCSGRPRLNQSPALKHAEYSGALCSSSEAKSRRTRSGRVFARVRAFDADWRRRRFG